MRPFGSLGLLAVCALFATRALGQEPNAAAPSAASSSAATTRRTLQLGPGSTVQYDAEPGDERSAGTLSVLPMPAPPAGTPPAAERKTAAPEPREQPAATSSRAAATRPCEAARARLAVRLLQLRGLEVDETTAPWILQRLAFYGDGLPLSALQSDLFARTLAAELAHCEAAAR